MPASHLAANAGSSPLAAIFSSALAALAPLCADAPALLAPEAPGDFPLFSDVPVTAANAAAQAAVAPAPSPFAQRFPVVAIAFSGGLDSSVLLDLAQAFATQRGIALCAFHIHHGINAHADEWAAHCQQVCAQRGIAFESRRIVVAMDDDGGVEEAARLGRYAALGELCRAHDAKLLLTAHHLNDQAETVLLQLLRGSGVAGLSGMESANRAPALLGQGDLMIARPLLSASRDDLQSHARAHAIGFVEDASNADTRYARNALRHQVMPVLEQAFPAFSQRFARAAGHMQSAQRLLEELARQDLALCARGNTLDMAPLLQLSPDRIDNLLRYWFAERGLRMPSAAWLRELRSQLLEAKSEAQLCVTHPACHIRRYRGRVYLTPKRQALPDDLDPVVFGWAGEAAIAMPSFGGVLHVDAATDAGIDAGWLRKQTLVLRQRRGGERLRLAANRPAKSLKYHYQSLDIPAWERDFLPLVGMGIDGEQLLYAASIGHDCATISEGAGRVLLRWEDSFGGDASGD